MEISDKDRKLLLKALLCYLPYRIKVRMYNGMDTILTIGNADLISMFYNEEDEREYICKPYLRRMEDMTVEERKKFLGIRGIHRSTVETKDLYDIDTVVCRLDTYTRNIDWLLENWFDVYGLIPKGLAYDIKTVE